MLRYHRIHRYCHYHQRRTTLVCCNVNINININININSSRSRSTRLRLTRACYMDTSCSHTPISDCSSNYRQKWLTRLCTNTNTNTNTTKVASEIVVAGMGNGL
jgi:hypothetical protein